MKLYRNELWRSEKIKKIKSPADVYTRLDNLFISHNLTPHPEPGKIHKKTAPGAAFAIKTYEYKLYVHLLSIIIAIIYIVQVFGIIMYSKRNS